MSNLREDGFSLEKSALSASLVHQLRDSLAVDVGRGGNRQIQGPLVTQLAWYGIARDLAREALGPAARPVRVLFFDKTPGANWSVPFHQDVTIAVERRIDHEGYGPWSVKAGVVHVQPPAEVLENMLAIRLHLDPCAVENGALRVIPGSHRSGKLTHEQMDRIAATATEVSLPANCGDAILMKPLLLHASSPSSTPNHRRVLHIEYAATTLPTGLTWALGDPPPDSSIIGQLSGGMDHQ